MKYHMITDVWVKVVHMLSQTPLRFFLYPHPGMIRITYRNFSVFEVCFLGSHKLVLLPNVVFSYHCDYYTVTRARFIESKILISNQENIEIYYINLDVFSIGNQCFAFNEPPLE